MIAFEIHINGERKFTAGSDGYDTLTASILLTKPPGTIEADYPMFFSTAGIQSIQPILASWPLVPLKPGDRIEINIVDVITTDPPESIERQDIGGNEIIQDEDGA